MNKKEHEFEPGNQYDNEYVICHHCGFEYGDCWEWVREEESHMNCNKCRKQFLYYASVSVTYCTESLEK